MELRRLRLGELIAGVAGLVLVVVMFIPWYRVTGPVGPPQTIDAWQAFAVLDVVLLVAALAGIALAVLTGTQRSTALPVAASVIVTALGVFVTILVLYRILNQPGPNQAVDSVAGAYIGLVSCAAIGLGGFLSMRDEGTSAAGAGAPAR